MTGLPEHIERRIAEAVGERNLYLLEILRRGRQNSTVLEVIVDAEEGVDLDTLAELSRNVGGILDEEEEAIRGRYRLEVSTPGLDRPLKHDWQYRKNTGRLIKVLWEDEEGTKRTDLFRLTGANETEITVEGVRNPKGKKGKKETGPMEPMQLPFSRIERVTVEPEL